jgi:hypothetical protein
MTTHEGLVNVQATWNSWRRAEVRLTDLHDLHWCEPPGAHARLLHAWIDCTDVVSGCMPHDCEASTAPHRLRVCLLKSRTLPRIYAQLAKGAVDAASVASQSLASSAEPRSVAPDPIARAAPSAVCR